MILPLPFFEFTFFAFYLFRADTYATQAFLTVQKFFDIT